MLVAHFKIRTDSLKIIKCKRSSNDLLLNENTDKENEDQAEGGIKQRSQMIDLSKEQEKKKIKRTSFEERSYKKE